MEVGIPWRLITPNGTIDFNTDGDGYRLESVSGMDMAALRTTVENLAQRDGAAVYDSFKTAMYPVLEGSIHAFSDDTLVLRRQMEDDLKYKLTSLIRANGTLQWQPRGVGVNEWREVTVRLFDALAISQDDAILKKFHFSLVAPEPVIYNADEDSAETSDLAGTPAVGTFGFPTDMVSFSFGDIDFPGYLLITNDGNADTYPILRAYGAFDGIRIINETTGIDIDFPALEIPAGSYVEINMNQESAYYNSLETYSLLSYMDIAGSDFWPLVPGDNEIRVFATNPSAGSHVVIEWKDAYV